MASEVTGSRWKAEFQQPASSEDTARAVEQAILTRYAKHRLASNGETLAGVDPLMVAAEISTLMRSRSTE